MNDLPGFTGDAEILAEAMVDTIHDSLLIFDSTLRVRMASRSFYSTFKVDPKRTKGCHIYELGTGQWNIPPLKKLLEDILPKNTAFYGFEISYSFPTIGYKVMLLNAKKVQRREGQEELILLAIEDITERRSIGSSQSVLTASFLNLRTVWHMIYNRPFG